jgi:hypothetical protein
MAFYMFTKGMQICVCLGAGNFGKMFSNVESLIKFAFLEGTKITHFLTSWIGKKKEKRKKRKKRKKKDANAFFITTIPHKMT